LITCLQFITESFVLENHLNKLHLDSISYVLTVIIVLSLSFSLSPSPSFLPLSPFSFYLLSVSFPALSLPGNQGDIHMAFTQVCSTMQSVRSDHTWLCLLLVAAGTGVFPQVSWHQTHAQSPQYVNTAGGQRPAHIPLFPFPRASHHRRGW